MKGSRIDATELEGGVHKYNEAFRKFVDAHEVCMQYEDDEEKKVLLIDSYNNQRDMKLQLEILLNEWRTNKQRKEKSPSESGFSRASSRSSVKEKKRLSEEAKLKMRALRERQDLDRQMEEIEKGKAELSRKIKLLDAETKVKQAAIELMIEQCVDKEEGADGMRNEYLENHHYVHDTIEERLAPQFNSCVPANSRQSAVHTSLPHLSHAYPQPPFLEVDREPLKQTYIATSSSKPSVNFVASAVQLPGAVSSHCISSEPDVKLYTPCCYTSPKMTSTPFTAPEKPLSSLARSSQMNHQPTSALPYIPAALHATAAEFRPVFSPPSQSTPYTPLNPQEHSLDAWSTIAQAIKQGPSLPKVELMKFSGDPLEYEEPMHPTLWISRGN